MNTSNFYSDYQKARDKSWEVIAKYNINSLPVDIFNLCTKAGITVVSYRQSDDVLNAYDLQKYTEGNDGFATIIRNHYVIFYDDTIMPQERIRFTIAHEIGHIVLGHLNDSDKTTWNRGEEQEPDEKETAANIFARDLLAPAGVLHALNVHDASEIMSLCGLSRLAASYRSKRMEALYQRETDRLAKGLSSCFGLNPKEKTALGQFEKFVNVHKQK